MTEENKKLNHYHLKAEPKRQGVINNIDTFLKNDNKNEKYDIKINAPTI